MSIHAGIIPDNGLFRVNVACDFSFTEGNRLTVLILEALASRRIENFLWIAWISEANLKQSSGIILLFLWYNYFVRR
jgi:hypothetical protein